MLAQISDPKFETDLFQSASVWVPDICLIWDMLDCLSRRMAELLNKDIMLSSEIITSGELGKLLLWKCGI